jgi:ABC-type sugar transport system ATPase subunit
MGIDVASNKLLAFVVGSFVAGIGGGIYAHYIGFLSPGTFDFIAGFNPLIIVVFGGLGSMTGTIAASFGWIFFLEGFLRVLLGQLGTDAPSWRFVLYPITLLLLMLVRPQGLLGTVEWGFFKDEPDWAARSKRPWAPKEAGGVTDMAEIKERRDHTLPAQEPPRPSAASSRSRTRSRAARKAASRASSAPTARARPPPSTSSRGSSPSPRERSSSRASASTASRASRSPGSGSRAPFRTSASSRTSRCSTTCASPTTAHAGYSLADSLLRTKRYEQKEKELTEKALDFLAIFKLEGIADEIAKNLPYGQQRRVEIARALACDPSLLLLDEPAAGMNPREIIELMDLIHFVKDRFDLTILLIEHQMRFVMGICEYITVMDFGEVIARGLPKEIQANQMVVEAYLGKGAGKSAAS